MKKRIIAFLVQHGFKFVLLALAAGILLRKDIDFRILLVSPVRSTTDDAPAADPFGSEPADKITNRKPVHQQLNESTSTNIHNSYLLLGGGASASHARLGATLFQRLEEADPSVVAAYIGRFGKLAQGEMERYGIPASVTTAQAMLNSTAGTSAAALKANNHFGIPCSTDWNGATLDTGEVCYRRYDSAWQSFRDHSDHITTGRFEQLTKLKPDDYKGWAKGLERVNFTTANDYAETLIRTIQTYHLEKFDW